METTERIIPKTGFAGLKENFKHDLLSGFTVSLIALPLCLGIAIASGVPPMAGLITAIVGGLLASRIAGSYVTISGPAAGLIVVNLAAVETLGQGNQIAGYGYALAAFAVAGGLVFLFGLFKVGKLGDFFPTAAVHGMLAAIGIIIMVKQAYVALGIAAPKGELLEVLAHLPVAFADMNPEIFTIGVISLVILIIHPMIKNKFIKMIPAPMWVLIATIPMAHALDLFTEHHYHFAGKDFIVGPKYLVNLPDNVMDGIHFPDFGKIGEGAFWAVVVTIALVSGLESLLSAKAVDTIDPYQRKSDLDRDLMAMGGGSSVAGLIGGLPMISEIVRSSANINNGARTQWANFFHAGFLLLFLLFGSSIIEQIPLAALAAMLIFTGFRLASPKEFKHMWAVGRSQLLIFIITIIAVLATDLLVGIAVGILTKLVLHLINGVPLSAMFKIKSETQVKADHVVIKVKEVAIFSNYISLKNVVMKNVDKGRIILDFENVKLIDHTFMDHIHLLQKELIVRGTKIELVGTEHLQPVSNHPLAARMMPRDKSFFFKSSSLNERQKNLSQLADSLEMEYTAERSLAPHHYKDFPTLQSLKINYQENVMSKQLPSGQVQFKEFSLVEGGRFATMEFNLAAVVIDNLPFSIPSFSLEREHMFDKMMDAVGYDDIDFDSHKEFSDKFLLQGPNRKKIEEFFTDKLLDFFSEQPVYHVESNGSSVMIYSQKNMPDTTEIKNIISFSVDLLATIESEVAELR